MSNPELTEREVEQSHTIDDLATELGRYKRANRAALDLLTDALHAADAGRTEVVKEFLERTIDDLYRTANPVVQP
jgi:hypothetical protein